MKKYLTVLLSSIIAVSLVGCKSNSTTNSTPNSTPNSSGSSSNSSSSTQPEKETELTVWAWDKNFNGAALDIADKLDASIKIKMVEMAKADTLKKINVTLASGLKDDLPDIVLIGDLSAPGYFMSYPGAFYDMTNVIDYSKFAGYKKDSVSYQGKSYGVPFDTGVAGMFYRRDYFEQAGYKEADVQNITWSEYIEIGKKVKEKTGKYLTTLNPGDLSLFQIMLQSAGTWYTDKDGKANLANNDVLKECFKVFGDLKKSGTAKLISTWAEYAGALNGGEVAATVSGCWLVPTITSQASQSGQWGIAPVPKMTSSSSASNMSSQGGSSWYVMAGSKNAKVSADFLKKTFAGSTELYNELLKTKGILGTYLPASNSEAYGLENKFFGGQKINANFAQWLGKVPQVNYGAYSFETQSILVPAVQQYLNGTDIDKCLSSAQQQLEQTIKK